MKRAALATAALMGFALAGGVPAGAGPPRAAVTAPRVPVMVAGRTRLLGGPRTVLARATTVVASGRRCALAAGTALATLAALRRAGGPAFHVRDFGACSARRPSASESLFVDRIGAERNRGADGWVYKVGHRAPSLGAGSPGIRARAGEPVLWFYCHQTSGGCQRTLELTASATRVAPGAPVTFTVRGYDDRGRGVTVAGASVVFAGATASTATDGRATLPAPPATGRYKASASARGVVPAFPLEVVAT
jgi:hypothetical protein